MHSREVFREREREVGLRNDSPIHTNLAGEPSSSAQDGLDYNSGCSQQQAVAMVRERLRSILLQVPKPAPKPPSLPPSLHLRRT